ncbi:hypothetical protein CMI37_25035 [Candidatus Pacearchaeota archaeon]|nr:hypothetical protein [Candidatus Pacearchaeota archaeon]|tara:strand:- start:5323 stop:6045 length:723 start_codon:yes stop_codon:yes gene_type:complete
MALNTLFPRQRELVNYDYFDIAEGVGYVVYFGLVGDAGENIVSTTSNIYSENICSILVSEGLSTSFVKKFNMDFDITYNRPKNIKGLIFANIPIGVAADDDTGTNVEFYAICKAIHYDGSTETTLATGTSRTADVQQLRTSETSFGCMIAACKMNVTTLKHFKKGETLRFTVEGWFKLDAGSNDEHLMICHDPKNRNFKTGAYISTNNELEFANEQDGGGTVIHESTQMIFHVPYVLDTA